MEPYLQELHDAGDGDAADAAPRRVRAVKPE